MTPSGSRQPPDANGSRVELHRRLSWLMSGRLVLATLLLGGTLALALERQHGVDSYTARLLLTLILSTYGLSLVYALWLFRGTRLRALGATQLALDVLLTAALTYASGGASSGFTFLYGVTILMAALTLGPRAALGVTTATLVSYTGLSLGLVSGSLGAPPDQPIERYLLTPPNATFTIAVNVVSLVVVAILANNLGQRLTRAGGELRAAAVHVANLAHLNESIIRSLSSGLVTTDPRLTIQTINPAGLEILRAQSSSVAGRLLTAFIADERLHAEGLCRAECVGHRADGNEFPVGFTKTNLIDAGGQNTGNLIVFQDLSEITELRDAAERAERLAALGRVASGLAHEIRNPLGAISGSVQLVSESHSLDPEDQRLLTIVVNEVGRLNDLVTTMLDLGRPVRPQYVPHDVTALAREVARVASQDRVHRQDVTITLDIPSNPVTADVDGGQLRQLLWNLVKNALQHSPSPGEVKIQVREKHKQVEVTVEDQGPGVPADARERLFDMFYSKRKHGIGLGLALCKQIVEAHGGQIHVETAVPQGSRFVARIPRHRRSTPTSIPSPELSSEGPSAPPGTSEGRRQSPA